jgi:putative transposase
MSKPDREKKLGRQHARLPARRQCQLLSLARSGVHRQRQGPDEAELALLRRIGDLHMAHPFLGSRRIAVMLRSEGVTVKRPVRAMGLQALGRPGPRQPVRLGGLHRQTHRRGHPGRDGRARTL